MIIAKLSKPAKVINFPTFEKIQIVNHRTVDNVTTFYYDFPLTVNRTSARSATGDYQVNVFAYQKKAPQVSIKQSEIAGRNFFRVADRQRIAHKTDQSLKRKYFSKKFIANSDLSLGVIPFQIEITEDQVFDKFTVEIINISELGNSSLIDRVEVDHSFYLKRYDLPSEGFRVTTSLVGRRKIFVAAVSDDQNIGAFNFSIKKSSGISLAGESFLNSTAKSTESTNIATVAFDVPDNSLPYTIRVNPISKITNQELGNFREVETGQSDSDKMLAFYMSDLKDESVRFKVASLSTEIKKVFLYRQKLGDTSKSFVTSAENTSSSVVLEDSGRISQLDFVYTIEYQTESGDIKKSANEVLVPALKLDKLASIFVERKTSTSTSTQLRGDDLVFNVSVNYNISSPYDQLFSDIKSLGLESIFSSDLEKMTNNIKPLTRVIVTRVSLITGFETQIGIFEPGEIVVSGAGSEPAIFRFEVAVKSVPDALESIAAAQNLISNNSYNLGSATDLSSKLIGNKFRGSGTNFSAKFYSKSSLKGSTLRYGDSEDISNLGYYSGRTGIFGDFVFTRPTASKVSVLSQKIIQTNRGYFLFWNSPQNMKNISHFLITVDGAEYMSHPSQRSDQIFFVGKNLPRNFTITPISQDPNLPEDLSKKGY
jgi:hypothetical protein